MDREYQRICEKLGFEPHNYVMENPDMEDDSKPNPFSVLTEAESDYLYENGYLNL